MTDTATSAGTRPPPIAAGWVLWLTWFYVVLFAFGVLLDVTLLAVGTDAFGSAVGITISGADLSLIWVLRQVPYIAFGIGCVGILLRDRDFAWVAVISAWCIVALQFVDAFLQIFHLRLSVPISAFIFGAYAWKMAANLRPRPAAVPPGARGTL